MTDFITINTPAANLEFPPDTKPEVIRDAIKQHAPTPEAREAALHQWADQYVARERAGGGMMQGVNDTVRNLARGTPLGSWADEANAGIHALGGGDYDEAKAYQNATDRAIDQGSAKLAHVPVIGDITPAGLTKLGGGVASAVGAPVAAVMKGATMLPRAVNAMATGAGYGAVYGAGEGDGVGERTVNAATGAGLGGAIGAAAVPVARGAAGSIGYLADKIKGIPAELQPYVRGAIDRVSRSTSADSQGNPKALPNAMADMGPEAMVADLGPNTRGQVGAVARMPGEGQTTAVNALDRRADTAGARIDQDVTQALGPKQNVPELLDRIDKHFKAQAGPLYDQFRATPIPYTPKLESIVETLKNEPSVLRDARRLANLDEASGAQQFFAKIDKDGNVNVERVPNAAEWDYIKRALDGLSYGASATGNDRRIYGGLANKIKGEIDGLLSPKDPGQSVWAQARNMSGEGKNIAEAAEAGSNAFKKNLSPDEMEWAMRDYSAPERAAYMVGARQSVRDVMGNASTKYGANPATAARTQLGSEYAQEKIAKVAPPAGAANLVKRLDTEGNFDLTREAAKGNSVTAATQAAQKEFPNVSDTSDIGRNIGQRSLGGVAMEGVYRLANALTGGAMTERRASITADAAKMLTAQGVDRDAIVRGLMDYQQSQGVTQTSKDRIGRLIEGLITAPRQTAIEGLIEKRK